MDDTANIVSSLIIATGIEDIHYEGDSFVLLTQLLSRVPGFSSLFLRMKELTPKTLASVATQVATLIFDSGLARVSRPADIGTHVAGLIWDPASAV